MLVFSQTQPTTFVKSKTHCSGDDLAQRIGSIIVRSADESEPNTVLNLAPLDHVAIGYIDSVTSSSRRKTKPEHRAYIGGKPSSKVL
jgi:hypothetical protein